MATHFDDLYMTLDGQVVDGQINSADLRFTEANVDTTNFASTAIMERLPTLTDITVTINTANMDSDESAATSIVNLMYAGSKIGGGDGIYAIVIQKVSSGTTPGTGNTTDPKYTLAMVADGFSVIQGDVTSIVGNQSITFSNATAATYARATS